MKKSAEKQEIVELTAEQQAMLDQGYPVTDDDSNRLTLPRFGMLSKDITEESGSGKNKKINIIQAAGTFYTEKDLGEIDENGKKKWTKTFIDGEKVDVVIVFHRKQLRKFDKSLKKYISSPIFDSSDQVIPLYLDKQIIKRGTQKELQDCYPALTQKGKPTSDLKEETILYVIYEGELYQCNLSQSSKYSFMDYRKLLNPAKPSSVVTTLSSIEDSSGSNTYSKMTFTKKRSINGNEFTSVMDNQKLLAEKVEADKRFFVPQIAAPADETMKALEAKSDEINADDIKFD